jgi:hypothetical protein
MMLKLTVILSLITFSYYENDTGQNDTKSQKQTEFVGLFHVFKLEKGYVGNYHKIAGV